MCYNPGELASRDEVLRVARLARLGIEGEEAELLVPQIIRILQYFSQLEEVDTAEVEPTFHVLPIVNAWREDEPTPSLPPEEVLAMAPDREGAYFRVPRVLEERETGE